MNTYGMHSIHGRAPTIASGLKLSRPDLMVFVITGDGDALSIGGNHLLHVLRRNVDVKIFLFNNRIYGLTKGQYSPTSELGKVTKSSPIVLLAAHPLRLNSTSEASFVARNFDTDRTPHGDNERVAHGGRIRRILGTATSSTDRAFADYTDREVRERSPALTSSRQAMLFGGITTGSAVSATGLRVVDAHVRSRLIPATTRPVPRQTCISPARCAYPECRDHGGLRQVTTHLRATSTPESIGPSSRITRVPTLRGKPPAGRVLAPAIGGR